METTWTKKETTLSKSRRPAVWSAVRIYDVRKFSRSECTGYINEEGRKVRVIDDIPIDQECPDNYKGFFMNLFIFQIYDFIKNRMYAIDVFVYGKIGWYINGSVKSWYRGLKQLDICWTVHHWSVCIRRPQTDSDFSEPDLQIRDSVDCQSNSDKYHCEINSYIEFFHQESLQVRTKFQGQFGKF